MEILLTRYIYPLEEPFPICKHQNLFFDNPQTEAEIEAVSEYIRQSYTGDSAHRQSEKVLKEIIATFCKTFSNDLFVQKFAEEIANESDVFICFAKMWIVIRFDDEGERQRISADLEQTGWTGGIVILNDENPIVKNSRRAIEWSYLLSLCIHSQGTQYTGFSFILEHKPHWYQEIEPNKHLQLVVSIFWTYSTYPEMVDSDESFSWWFFPVAREALAKVCKLADETVAKDGPEQIEYVASLLKNAGHDVKDPKTRLVVLVSIIELLLTHNPDFNRYNIEDSINKQFQLKAAMLIYLHDRSKQIDQIKTNLKGLYALRSMIAHGNFKGINKLVKDALRQKPDADPLGNKIVELYDYIRTIIYEYMNDPVLVNFLKEG